MHVLYSVRTLMRWHAGTSVLQKESATKVNDNFWTSLNLNQLEQFSM